MTVELKNKAESKTIRAVFVLTPGRSGSMWLAWALHQLYYSVISLHEPGVMIKDLAFQYYRGTVTQEDAIRHLSHAKRPAIDAARLYMKKSHYIEIGRNLFSLALPLEYAVKSPQTQVQFIGLVGDGRTFVRSMANKGAYTEHRPYGWFRPKNHPRWDSYSQIQKLSWHWVEKIRLIMDSTDQGYAIERLTNSRHQWNLLAKDLGLPLIRYDQDYTRVARKRINHTPCNLYTHFSDIPEHDRAHFWEIAGPTMEELGYA